LSHASHPPTPLFADSPRRWLRLLPYVVVVALTAALLPVTIEALTGDYGVSGGVAGALAVGQTSCCTSSYLRAAAAEHSCCSSSARWCW
jgi:hypothetical protein